MGRLSTAAAVAFVLFVYTFFGSIGELAFPRVYWDQGFGKRRTAITRVWPRDFCAER